MVIAAWGSCLGNLADERWANLQDWRDAAGDKLHVLALTKSGRPAHPLRLAKDKRPIPW